ncbi:MAG: hypothetical protein EBQ99_01920 [Planctomycetes bacterium]|nr:hypothetical protein [Planctomycetota bacterium]
MLAVLPLLAGWVLSLACGRSMPSILQFGSIESLDRFPGARVDREFIRLRPHRLGTLVPLAAGTCEYSSQVQDDGADLAMALGVSRSDRRVRGYVGATNLQEIPAEIPEEFWLYAEHRLPWSAPRNLAEPHAADAAAEGEDQRLDADARVALGGVDLAMPPQREPGWCCDRPDGWVGDGLTLTDEATLPSDPLRQILALPPEARCWRSVWAAYRLGREQQDADPEAAIEWFRKVRQLASEGYADSLGMAAASIGWEARAAMQSGRLVDAMHLYLEHWAAGYDATRSLRIVCQHALESPPELLRDVAADPVAASLVTAYLNGSNWERPDWMDEPTWIREDLANDWLRALEQAGTVGDIGADRAAMLAYRHADFELADRWACLAPDSALAAWVKAKLAVRRGDLDAAAEHYATVARGGDPALWWLSVEFDVEMKAGSWRMGEHAIVMLARDRYAEALDMLLRGCFWGDAAYVAERVMTSDELRAVVDGITDHDPTMLGHMSLQHPQSEPRACRAEIRYLLARRLAREGRWALAAGYMPAGLQASSHEIEQLLKQGKDPVLPPSIRASALWAAAQRMRQSGMELVGTELWPDQHRVDGQYQGLDELQCRIDDPPATGMLPTRLEVERAEAAQPTPALRFHYRYVAAELAWQAAMLMPDQDPQTARVLWIAGRWLAPRDPKAADRFYKALVRRCGDTPLGEAARRERWLPVPTLRWQDNKQS